MDAPTRLPLPRAVAFGRVRLRLIVFRGVALDAGLTECRPNNHGERLLDMIEVTVNKVVAATVCGRRVRPKPTRAGLIQVSLNKS